MPDLSKMYCVSFSLEFLSYLFVLLVRLLGDLLCLSELRLERRRPVVLHVRLVLQRLPYPAATRLKAKHELVKSKGDTHGRAEISDSTQGQAKKQALGFVYFLQPGFACCIH